MLVLLTRPFLWVLGRVPTGVLAGQFLYLAIAGTQGNSLVERLRYLVLDRSVADVRVASYAVLPYRVVAMFTDIAVRHSCRHLHGDSLARRHSVPHAHSGPRPCASLRPAVGLLSLCARCA